MNCFDQAFPDADEILFAPVGDWHVGHGQCDIDGIKEHVEEIKKRKGIVFLMGDLTENALTTSKGSVYDQVLSPKDQIKLAIELLDPIRDQIIGGIDGNHGARTDRAVGLNLDEMISFELGSPHFGSSACGRFKMANDTDWRLFIHHGTGGGRLMGNKLNMISDRMTKVVPEADLYVAGHTHADVAGSDSIYSISLARGKAGLTLKRRHFSGTGSMLGYDAYPEAMMLPPSSKCQVFHYLGQRKHIADKGAETYRKGYRREPQYY